MFEAEDRRDNLPLVSAEHADTGEWMEQNPFTITDSHGEEVVKERHTDFMVCTNSE